MFKNIKSACTAENLIPCVVIPCLALLQWLIVQLCCQSAADCFRTKPVYILIESTLLLAVDALIALCTGRWWIGFCVTSVFAAIYGIANHYVIDLHGTPLSLRDFGNIGVTGEVMKGYVLEISGSVVLQAVLFALCIAGTILLMYVQRRQKKFEWWRCISRSIILAGCGLIMFLGIFSAKPLKPAETRSWDWQPALRTYGCLSCLVENTMSSGDIVLEPENYSLQEAQRIAESYEAVRQEETVTPDIIFILNETYYDLSVITDLETDVDPFAALNRRDDLIRGYAASPVIGGGTNCSEYEFLTGNSLCLTPGITPFQSIDMQGADGIVSRLEVLGYSSLCANSESAGNYFRSTGYPGLGFDEIYFSDAFTGQEYYGNRGYESDRCLYENLIGWYENMGDAPRFAYTLTIQNHGGYILSDESYDTVHVQNDYGERNDEIDEYLTGISLSAEALCDLIDYFEQGDRPVVVCMVGDHCPHFAKEIVDDRYTPEQADLRLRMTPYVVWSNCGFDESAIPEILGLHALSSCVLSGANVELSPYDSYVAEMCRDIPVLLSCGDWYDRDGIRHSVRNEEAPQVLSDYLVLLCNNITGGEHRLERFFRIERNLQ